MKRFLSCSVAVLIVAMVVGYAIPADGAPAEQKFASSSLQVLPGDQVTMHWVTSTTPSGQNYLLTSTLPGFSSGTGLTWPPSTTETWDGVEWNTTAGSLTVTIPSNATAGISYAMQLTTCDSSGCNSTSDQATLTVPNNSSEWSETPFSNDYPNLYTVAQTAPASPLDAAFTSDGTLWNSSEFSNEIAKSTLSSGVLTHTTYADTSNTTGSSPTYKPFEYCFTTCGRVADSALSERVISAYGRVWFTFGGWQFYSGTLENHSEIVSFDPATNKFCTYLVPGNNNEVIGMAADQISGQNWIYYVESWGNGTATLDGFQPSAYGDQCPGTKTEVYKLLSSVKLPLTWPTNSGYDIWPALITPDPYTTVPTLWVSDVLSPGGTVDQVDEVDVSTPGSPTLVQGFTWTNTNSSTLAAQPWEVAVDSSHVYVIDYGDDNLIRIDTQTGYQDEVPLPVTSDTEEGYGLAINGNNLYFTLANDGSQTEYSTFGAASTLGYIDLATWSDDTGSTQDQHPSTGVIYTGLDTAANPTSAADFRGLAIDSTNGNVGITDLNQMVELAP